MCHIVEPLREPPTVGGEDQRGVMNIKKWASWALITLGLVGVLACGAGGKEVPTNPAPAAGGTGAPAAAPAGAGYSEPVIANFKVTVKVTKKSCFGSAGCNIEFRISPKYTGTLDPSKTYEVTYEVSGVEDGPKINTFQLTGSTATVDETELASTKSSKVKLTVKVTDVTEA